jgi:hypothetical protein
MTREQIRNVVLTHHSNRDDKTDLINSAIDLGVQEIGRRFGFSSARTVTELSIVTDQNTVALPDDCVEITRLRMYDSSDDKSNAVLLELLSKKFVLDQYPDLSVGSSNEPAVAFVENQVLTFVPPTSQDRVIEVSYHSLTTALTEDSDENPYSGTDNALIAWVTSYVYKSLQMTEDAMLWMRTYEDAMEKVIKSDLRRDGEWIQMRGAMFGPQARQYPIRHDPYVNKYTRR